MKRAAKWIGIILGIMVLLCAAAVIIVPMLVDLNSYKPAIEKKVSDATGRPFRLGGEIKLSLFPWAGVSLSDLHLGNPEGFKEKDFVSVKSFEVRVKVMPLIKKALEVERFVVNGPRIYMLKDSRGRANWEGLGGTARPAEKPKGPSDEKKASSELPLAALAVGEFAVKDGYLVMQDDTSGTKRELSDINIGFKDISLDRPIGFNISAKMDGKPVSVDGMVGPVGKMPGMGSVSVEISMKALGELAATLKGKVVDPAAGRKLDLDLAISPFSPRRLMESAGQKFPVTTSDPEVLKKISISMHISGDPTKLNITDGKMELDSSKLDFAASLSEFDRPKASFKIGLDAIDLDRYMPPASNDKKEGGATPAKANKARSDYSALRKPVIDGTLKAGSLKVKGVKAENILLTLDARDGLFQIKPLKMDLYKGNLALTARYDVRKDIPSIAAEIKAEGIQARPLLMDMAGKDFLEGTAKVRADVRTSGDDPLVIKQNLNGAGELLFTDGAIVGIDLAGMLRNLKVSLGLEKQTGEKPRTDFAELKVPFTIEGGVAATDGTNISSPLLRVLATGKADLVKETLDLRIEPKLVATIKGQGDAKDRSGLTVPVLVKGTFASPSFAPDLEGLLKQGLDKNLPDPSKLKDQLKELKPEKGMINPPEGMKLNLPLGR